MGVGGDVMWFVVVERRGYVVGSSQSVGGWEGARGEDVLTSRLPFGALSMAP